MGFAALFCLVGTFTYANFYLAAPPYHLNSEQLGSIFFVYLLGLIVTPLSGRCLDRYGIGLTSIMAVCFTSAGLLLTLLHSLPVIVVGLALASSGVFIYQAVGTVQTGIVAGQSAVLGRGIVRDASITSAAAWELSSPAGRGWLEAGPRACFC